MVVWSANSASNFLKSKFWKLFYIFFDKMVSIIINIIQHEQYFQAHVSAVCLFLWKSHHIMCSLISHYLVKNKCNRVKGRHWRWLIYVLCNFLLHSNMLRVFRSNHNCSWKFHRFHRKTPVSESLFSLKWWNYIKAFVLHE